MVKDHFAQCELQSTEKVKNSSWPRGLNFSHRLDFEQGTIFVIKWNFCGKKIAFEKVVTAYLVVTNALVVTDQVSCGHNN